MTNTKHQPISLPDNWDDFVEWASSEPDGYVTAGPYPENLPLAELSRHFAMYRSNDVLKELERRDNQIRMIGVLVACHEYTSNLEPDNQLAFDFYKEVVSAEITANNRSVKTVLEQMWEEAYEDGRRIGFKQGLKEAQSCDGIREEGECDCGNASKAASRVIDTYLE